MDVQRKGYRKGPPKKMKLTGETRRAKRRAKGRAE